MIISFTGINSERGQWVVFEPTAGGWGIFDGHNGQPPEIEIRQPDGTTYTDLKMRPTRLPAGTLVQTRTGGGGYGNALERCATLVANDVLHGYVTEVRVRDTYGVIFHEDGNVDNEATLRQRSRLAKQ